VIVIQQHLVTYEVPEPDEVPDFPHGWGHKIEVELGENENLIVTIEAADGRRAKFFRDPDWGIGSNLNIGLEDPIEEDDETADRLDTAGAGLFLNVEREVYVAFRRLLDMARPRIIDRHKPLGRAVPTVAAPVKAEDFEF
jgi:hypothetical protein